MWSFRSNTNTSSNRSGRAPIASRAALAVLAALAGCSALVAAPVAAAELSPERASSTGSEWSGPGWRWRRVALRASGQGEGLIAVAVELGATGRVAVGDLEGVSLRETDSEAFRFAARVAGVTDLAFAPDGTLWIASLSGLFSLSRDGRLSDRAVAPGELARSVRRVVVGASGLLAVATEAGAFASADGRLWSRLADGLPAGPVATLAVRDLDGESGLAELWIVVGVELWRVEVARGAGRLELRHASRVVVPGAPAAVAPNDVVVDLSGAALVLVFPQALAVQRAARPGDPDSFRIVRPVLPPGAVARRIVSAAGRLWLATDQGLLHAARVEGPWWRSEVPAGSTAILALAATGARDAVLAAGPSGLLHGAPVAVANAEPRLPVETPDRSVVRDPDIRAVHAASLRYLDLGPERMRELWAGAGKRGWLPSVSLQLGAARDRAWARTQDQTFVSGETRYLRDRDEDDALDLDASVVVSWDLADLAFDTASIDVSREHRLIVSLRDNVTDEINQLYFERRALLDRLREAAPDAAETRALELRAAELAAGLDAWTGGWFSSAVASAAPSPAPSQAPTLHPPLGPRPNPEDSR